MLESNYSVAEATNRVFRLGYVHVLSHLKKMVQLFGMTWNFVTIRCGRRIFCNRTKQYGYSNTPSRKK